jgi:hypothetical protein
MIRGLPLLALCGALSCAQPPPATKPAPTVEPPRPAQTHAPARSFVITRREDLLSGQEADGQIGDLRIDNGLAVFIIDAAQGALGFADSGGNLIDAAQPGHADSLKQLFGYLDDTFPRQPIYTRVVPGRRGELATVSAFGKDSLDGDVSVETEYALAPGSRALVITTRVTNGGKQKLVAYEIGDAIQWGRCERFAPGIGFSLHGKLTINAGYLLGLGEEVSYAYGAQRGPLMGPHGSAWSDLDVVTVDLEPGKTAVATRFFAVGDADLTQTYEAIAEQRGEKWAHFRGRALEEGSGANIAGVRVVLEDDAGKPVSVAHAGGSGYHLLAPPGIYKVRIEGQGRRAPGALSVDLQQGRAMVDVMLSQPGGLAFEIEEGGSPSPGKITVLGRDATPTPRLGPPYRSPGGEVAVTADGRGQLTLPWGHYRVVASRGLEFTIDARDLEINPGETTVARFKLTRAVDMRGMQCADLHQHAAPSADSGVSLRDRLATNLAEGLEIFVPTDHNVMVDWAPAIAELKATRPLALVPGDEATLDGIGHWNAYPLTVHADRPRGGALDVRNLNPHQILAGLRAADGPTGRVIQVNHPRAGFIGYFNRVKLDPKGDALPPDWEGGFDAIEVFSSKDVSHAMAPLKDWLWLLDRGYGYTAVGGSDSHTVAEWEIGYPRTCIGADKGDAARSAGERLVDAIVKRHDAIITNGPIVFVSIGGKGIGQLAIARGGRAKLDVEVQAAPWIDVTSLELLVNGERRGPPLPIKPSTARVRHKASIELRLKSDAHVVLLVRGEKSLEPVVTHNQGRPPPLPLAITNPIFVDGDGDGQYTAPKKQKK